MAAAERVRARERDDLAVVEAHPAEDLAEARRRRRGAALVGRGQPPVGRDGGRRARVDAARAPASKGGVVGAAGAVTRASIVVARRPSAPDATTRHSVDDAPIDGPPIAAIAATPESVYLHEAARGWRAAEASGLR